MNAELLIDHAWGYEPCTIQDIRAYQPAHHSIGMGQVLSEPYTYDKAALVLKEMADQLALNLVEKRLVSDQIILDIGYDSADVKRGYRGETHIDRYGRKVPRHAHGKARLKWPTSSSMQIREALLALYARISDTILVRAQDHADGGRCRQRSADCRALNRAICSRMRCRHSRNMKKNERCWTKRRSCRR